MDIRRKLELISERLGDPGNNDERRSEFGFLCPGPDGSGCDSSRAGKRKLFVNLKTDRFHCWVCDFGGSDLSSLMARGSKGAAEYRESKGSNFERQEVVELQRCSTLPNGFTPFWSGHPIQEGRFIRYLRRRKIDDETIQMYRMGYVTDGRLADRIVIPTFDRYGMVNFWNARTVRDVRPSYMFPIASKEIVPNEHMVDWSSPIVLVEGIFDAISVGPQAIPLFGKFVNMTLMARLVSSSVPMVHVCLDRDAWKESFNVARTINSYGIKTTIVDLPGKDPGSMDYESIWRSIGRARPFEPIRDRIRKALV